LQRLLRRRDLFRGRVDAVFGQVDAIALPVMSVPVPTTERMNRIDDELIVAIHRFTCPFAMSGHARTTRRPERESFSCCGKWVASMLFVLACGGSQAARPMATDDTATAPAGTCQIEAWVERVDAERAQVIAPACGLTGTLELDTAATRIQGGGGSVDGLVAGLKWVPGNTVYENVLGTVRLGVLGGVFWTPDPGSAWKADTLALAGLSSLEFAPAWTLYANLLTSRDLDTGQHVNGLRAALAWQPDERWLLFVEGLRSSDSSNLRNAGFRFWAIPEVLGLNLVTTRSANGGFSVSICFGWSASVCLDGMRTPSAGRCRESTRSAQSALDQEGEPVIVITALGHQDEFGSDRDGAAARAVREAAAEIATRLGWSETTPHRPPPRRAMMLAPDRGHAIPSR
jgi:hypothetical protein